MRAILNLVIGWKLWAFFQKDIRRLVVIGLGLVLVSYISNEIEKILVLNESSNGLVGLILAKNLAYLVLVIAFFVWPYFRKKVVDTPEVLSKDLHQASDEALDTDGYEFIRLRGHVRAKSEIFDELISKTKLPSRRKSK